MQLISVKQGVNGALAEGSKVEVRDWGASRRNSGRLSAPSARSDSHSRCTVVH